jgi:hypothetical protein
VYENNEKDKTRKVNHGTVERNKEDEKRWIELQDMKYRVHMSSGLIQQKFQIKFRDPSNVKVLNFR